MLREAVETSVFKHLDSEILLGSNFSNMVRELSVNDFFITFICVNILIFFNSCIVHRFSHGTENLFLLCRKK
jgi:hypothetical protein